MKSKTYYSETILILVLFSALLVKSFFGCQEEPVPQPTSKLNLTVEGCGDVDDIIIEPDKEAYERGEQVQIFGRAPNSLCLFSHWVVNHNVKVETNPHVLIFGDRDIELKAVYESVNVDDIEIPLKDEVVLFAEHGKSRERNVAEFFVPVPGIYELIAMPEYSKPEQNQLNEIFTVSFTDEFGIDVAPENPNAGIYFMVLDTDETGTVPKKAGKFLLNSGNYSLNLLHYFEIEGALKENFQRGDWNTESVHFEEPFVLRFVELVVAW